MDWLIFVPLSAAAALLLLGLVNLTVPAFGFWPPPQEDCWQKKLFIGLFRTQLYGVVLASLWHFWAEPEAPFGILRGLGVILFGAGFAVAFMATFGLGWSNAFGAQDGLRVDGIFRYSRNPVYIATWIGLTGWALIVPDGMVRATLAIWASVYLVAIFLEERWLLARYGGEFRAYCEAVPRFI